MAFREVKSRYVGSTLGAVWTLIPPMVLIFVFWFVFSVGFRTVPKNDVPFVVWLTAGITSWFVFSDMLMGATGSVTGNGNLVKKTIFPVQILPIVKIVSSLVTHACFLVILLVLLFLNGYSINLYFLQFVYYLGCLLALATGLGWIFSALNVFVRDVSQLVGLILQVGFWGTPIFWDISMMPDKIQLLLKLNPMFYIVQGYRDTFIYSVPFWEHPVYSLYFWVVTALISVAGLAIFKKLKPQFADVL